jgi:hypothetical protein
MPRPKGWRAPPETLARMAAARRGAREKSIWREIDAGMVAERTHIWLPWLEAIDARRQVQLAEYGLAPNRFRRRLPARTDPG